MDDYKPRKRMVRISRDGLKHICIVIFIGVMHITLVRPAQADGPDKRAGTAIRGVLMSEDQATAVALVEAKRQGFDTLVLNLDESVTPAVARQIAKHAKSARLALYYWIEIGRNPAMADAHPQWMASLQGHPEWRRYFPKAPNPSTGEVTKNYPWVPVLYQETLAAHTNRVAGLLKNRPTAEGVFLNDLQAAPSACGCGNQFCRWTPDYGPIKTAKRLPDDAAARFVTAVRKLAPRSAVIPVWTTECEEHEMAADSQCAGVHCFTGTCWYEYTKQLMPLASASDKLAVLTPFRAFGRDDPRYGAKAGWVTHALTSFSEMPPKRKGSAISANRLIAVLQGWSVSREDEEAQIQRVGEAGAAGYIVSKMKIEQGWEPRIVKAVPVGGGPDSPDPHAGHEPH